MLFSKFAITHFNNPQIVHELTSPQSDSTIGFSANHAISEKTKHKLFFLSIHPPTTQLVVSQVANWSTRQTI